jgi:hypothetical protein
MILPNREVSYAISRAPEHSRSLTAPRSAPLGLIEQRFLRRGARHRLDCDDTITGLGMIGQDFWPGMRTSVDP